MDGDVASSNGGGEKKSGGETVVIDSGRRHSSCGYCCSSSSSSISHGMLAYSLTAHDYQELLDRGWRRSGCYLYKPEMDKTCCPQYTIRLKATNFSPSKEQDRVLKKMQRYLDGTLDVKTEKSNPNTSSVPVPVQVPVPESQEKFLSLLSEIIADAVNAFFETKNLPLIGQTPKPVVKKVNSQMKQKLKEQDLIYTCNVSFQIAAFLKKIKNEEMQIISLSPNSIADDLAGAISSILEKINTPSFVIKACNGHINFYSSDESVNASNQNLENAPQSNKSGQESKQNYENAPQRKKTLEIRTKRSEFDPVEFALYEKYQTIIHKDKRISKESYTRFLIDTPIKYSQNPNPSSSSSTSPPCGFGSFHQQYLIDGTLVAVGVVDVLPKCLSSKYLFWDPDYAFLSLGKFSALKEVQWVRENSLEYYYLGFYIHSCAKMRYKAKYRPSELLCPLRYEWVPYEFAKPLLDQSKYAVLSDYSKQEINTQLVITGDENGEENGENDELMNDVDDEEAEYAVDMDDDDEDDDDDDVVMDDSFKESIGEIMLDVLDTRVKYKDLQKLFVVPKNYLSRLEKQIKRYIGVVGKDLSERIVYSLG